MPRITTALDTGRIRGAVRRSLPVIVVTLVTGVVGSLFLASYSSALGEPIPRNVPIGVVGPTNLTQQVNDVVDAQDRTTYRVSRFDNEMTARGAIERQDVYGVLVARPDGRYTLLTSAAASLIVANMLDSLVPSLEAGVNGPVTVDDLHPLHAHDPEGLVIFYVALATIIVGTVSEMQTRTNAPKLTEAGFLAADVFRVAIVSLMLSVTVVIAGHFETTPLFALWGILALGMMAAGSTVTLFRLIVGGRWILIPTWLLFTIVSNPASGGAVAPQLLPPVYSAIGRFLPTGATVRAVRDVSYFPDAIHLEPFIVLSLWIVVTRLASSLIRAVHGRRDNRTATPDTKGPAT
ncbi:DUF3533 domain-containing protein [Frondihabitans australicus]|uniref:Uncharacterized protein DUF3533 n=1 Tax=Frondihabitans australicus TaxID=386892 RepID=A0A495IMG9_9MICO|nr:DUF3533 domain-containing protein [Frondihabitans australicus]RKR76315.1 uncharacterized protein DUF3533 [Frondihabitans australicus]